MPGNFQPDYKAIFEGSQGCFLIILPDPPKFTLVAATDLYLEMVGRTRETLIKMGVFEAFPFNPNDAEAKGLVLLRESLERVISTKQLDALPVIKYDVINLEDAAKNYQSRFWSVVNYPILNSVGEVIYILNKSEDVTDLVELRKAGLAQSGLPGELESRTKKMEQDIISRAQEIKDANNLLISLNDKLESSNKELEAFSYSVSHDLRAPVRHITSFAELLRNLESANISEKGKRYLSTIIESAQRMATLIDDLLSFSRLGRTGMHRINLKMQEVVQEAIRELALDTTGRNIAWKIEELPTVYADRHLLKMVLLNLIGNAVKFTAPRSDAVIEIGVTQSKDKEPAIFIKDNGVGYDSQYADKLFGVFQRLHTKTEFEGTGIGLANVQRIILMHGGRVWSESELDKGATFYFTLPAQGEERT